MNKIEKTDKTDMSNPNQLPNPNPNPNPTTSTQDASDSTISKMATEVEMLDIGCGNTGSVRRCLERLGVKIVTVGEDLPPSGNLPLIFPGVGAFGSVMNLLAEKKQDKRLPELIKAGVPYLGICVGLQILLDNSEESPKIEGLGLIKGSVKAFTKGKVPQIGWNRVSSTDDNRSPSGYAYFVNSYYATPDDTTTISHYTEYFERFASGIKSDNMTAYQFHPEKSGDYGETLIKGWLADVI